ncbi:DUF1963 domain-containing protein [Photobacterium sp. Hal280]|uniref:DUF1963 domain-containing protein n=1 Tax=Photobacterium sp. Hal280 TaxID=3035163 RepID=UPI00301B9C88
MDTVQVLEFEVSDTLQKLSVTKFGGQPDWIDSPQWPLSKELGMPMRFICQISLQEIGLKEYSGKIAYIFMTEENDEYVDGTWEHDGGENAIIIQPNSSTQLPTKAIASGPTRNEFQTFLLNRTVEPDSVEGCRVGGEPAFMQGEEFPEPKSNWKFFAQLDSCSMPFEVNFGDAGIGYAFINDEGSQGKFLWQCG